VNTLCEVRGAYQSLISYLFCKHTYSITATIVYYTIAWESVDQGIYRKLSQKLICEVIKVNIL